MMRNILFTFFIVKVYIDFGELAEQYDAVIKNGSVSYFETDLKKNYLL